MPDEKALSHHASLVGIGSRQDSMRDFDRASSEVLEFLSRRVGFMHWIIVRHEGSQRRVVKATPDAKFATPGDLLTLPEPLDQECLRGTRICFVADTKKLLGDLDAKSLPYGPIRAFLEMPIYFDDGTQFGSVCAIDPMPQPPELGRDLQLVGVFTSIIGWLIEMEQGAQELAREADRASALAMTDELTNLPNRRAWSEVIDHESKRAIRLGACPQILYIDVDELKHVNDTQGHAAGDELLGKTGQVILGACRSSDFVARIGGDEFGVLVLSGGASESILSNRIRSALLAAGIQCSIGASSRKPPFELTKKIQEADKALYEEKRVKKSGRGQAAVHLNEENVGGSATVRDELEG